VNAQAAIQQEMLYREWGLVRTYREWEWDTQWAGRPRRWETVFIPPIRLHNGALVTGMRVSCESTLRKLKSEDEPSRSHDDRTNQKGTDNDGSVSVTLAGVH